MRSFLGVNGLTIALAFIALPAHAQIQSIEDFAKHDDDSNYVLDYTIWEYFLKENVFYNGQSDRHWGADAITVTGSNLKWGHGGRYSAEGNRVMFSLMHRSAPAALTEYRKDLERISSKLDFAALSRDEQLAFWLNLHNVALIERIAHSYPRTGLKQRYENLFEKKDLTVAGVPLSLNDIRLRIVFENWRDKPNVIYGFWMGIIGGPSIQPVAFNSDNLDRVLKVSGTEFVNSLRGVDRLKDGVLEVSEYYKDARPYFFEDWPDDLIAHLGGFAQEKVKPLLAGAREVRANVSDWAIADLVNGEPRQPIAVISVGKDGISRFGGRLPTHGRVFIERSIKRQRRMARERKTRIIIIDLDDDLDDERDDEPVAEEED